MTSEANKITASREFVASARLSNIDEYKRLYKESIEHPQDFWARVAADELLWASKWDEVLSYDWQSIGSRAGPFVEWFKGGHLNVSANCLVRHCANGFGDK